MDDVIFTPHALEQMARDNITREDVELVVGDADDLVERDDGRTIYFRMLDDGRQVIAIVEDETRTVETVWWNKRGSRRRRR